MIWRLEFRPEVEDDVAETAAWYNTREHGLGNEFVEEVITVWERLATDPVTGSHRHRNTKVRWRYPQRFPYRVIYEPNEETHVVLVIAVLHAARHDRHWQARGES